VRNPFARRGRILAVKWGYNPNSSSLGVDVTFLIFGMALVALLTPIISLILRARAFAAGGPAFSSDENTPLPPPQPPAPPTSPTSMENG
jgi:hypothetical protein